MEKSPEAFRTISEVAEDLDLPQHVLRFWETRFPQIKPLKRGGGRRYYRPEDVDLLRAIKQLLYGEGYTIKGVQKLVREQGALGLARSARESSGSISTREDGGAGVATPPDAAADLESPEVPRFGGREPAPEAAPVADVTQLRAILADLREAERILAQSRAL
ncbi:MAG TPA: MerR family transcriptional regulator [Roseiarcus sp.]|jgi:DNA-binding transcriptional MerR regulator